MKRNMRVTSSVECFLSLRKTNLIEFLIEDKKVQVHDNVLSDKIVKQWINFYENSAKFTLSAFESAELESSPVFFNMPITLKERIEVFEFDEWLPSYLHGFNPACTLKCFNRSYINLMTRGDTANGHVDTVIAPNSDTFYITCLLFLNPYVDSAQDNGFTVGNTYIENKFNRMVIFDGTLFHKSSIPTDNLARLTLYLGFTNLKIKNSYAIEQSVGIKNQWFKNTAQQI